MKNLTRLIFSLVITAVVSVALFGCGNNNTPSNNNTAQLDSDHDYDANGRSGDYDNDGI